MLYKELLVLVSITCCEFLIPHDRKLLPAVDALTAYYNHHLRFVRYSIVLDMSLQQGHKAWIQEARSLVNRQLSTGVINSRKLRQLLETIDRHLDASGVRLDDNFWFGAEEDPLERERVLAPALLKEIKELKTFLESIARHKR